MSLDKRSIELGTEGWGVKEDNLLAFRKDRTRYVEKPFTFSRASEGTIINSNGYIQYSGLGDELVTNGTFDEDASWQKDTSWDISGGKAIYDGINHVQDIRQNVAFQSGRLYKITFTISDVDEAAGKKAYFALWTVSNGSDQVFNYTNFDNGTYIYYYTPTNGSILMFNALNNVDGGSFSLDNVSVKQVEQETPRISYDIVDGVVSDKPHLLLEPARTNLFRYSEAIDNWSYTSNTTISKSLESSPDGLYNSREIQFSGSGLSFVRVSGFSYTGASSLSLFAKKINWRYLGLRNRQGDGEDHTVFDFDTETFSNVASGQTASFQKLNNGWYRIIVVNPSSETSPYAGFAISNESGTENMSSGQDTLRVLVYGAQLEQGSYATSYIPNFGNTSGVTRAAETANNCGAVQDFNSEEGVLYGEINPIAIKDQSGYFGLLGTSTANRVILGFPLNTNNLTFFVVSQGTTLAQSSYDIDDMNQYIKVALKYKENDFALWVNGSEVLTDSSGTPNVEISHLGFYGYATNQPFYGKTKELKIYTETLNNAELRLLTKYAPKDYDASFTADYVDNLAEFTVLRTEATDKLYYSISDGTNSISGSATITATQVTISNIDISSLSDGTLTLSVYIEDERKQRGVTVTDTTIKDTTNTPLYSYALQQRATGATFEDLDNSESIIESLNVEV